MFSISVLKQVTENKYKTSSMPITFVPFFSKSKTEKGSSREIAGTNERVRAIPGVRGRRVRATKVLQIQNLTKGLSASHQLFVIL